MTSLVPVHPTFLHTDKSTWYSSSSNSSNNNSNYGNPQYIAGAKAPLPIISPSILASDFTILGAECESVLHAVYLQDKSDDNNNNNNNNNAAASAAGAEWLHVDIMDGQFVPNISIGVGVVESLRRRLPTAFLDCHLMIADPLAFVQPFAAAGATQFTFHAEAALEAYNRRRLLNWGGGKGGASNNNNNNNNSESTGKGAATQLMSPAEVIAEVCEAVHHAGMLCGVAIKPGTLLGAPGASDLHQQQQQQNDNNNNNNNSSNSGETEPGKLQLDASFLLDVIRADESLRQAAANEHSNTTTTDDTSHPRPRRPLIDLLLIMTVEPGFGGQRFQPSVLSKVSAARAAAPSLNIQVDGGIAAATAAEAAAAGANVMVAGTSVFKAADRHAAIAEMREAARAKLEEL